MNSHTMFVVAPFVVMGGCAVVTSYLFAPAARRTWGNTIFVVLLALLALAILWAIVRIRSFSLWTMLIPYLVCVPGVWWIHRRNSPKTRWFPLSVVALASAGVGGGYQFLHLPMRAWDELEREALSPDGRYVASLWYQEQFTMGYEHVDLQLVGWTLHGSRTKQIAEMMDAGITNLSWSGPRTLVVEYDGAKHKDKSDDTDFVSSTTKWGDVQIIYRPK